MGCTIVESVWGMWNEWSQVVLRVGVKEGMKRVGLAVYPPGFFTED